MINRILFEYYSFKIKGNSRVFTLISCDSELYSLNCFRLDCTMCAEDFSFYLQQRPGCFFFVGSGILSCANDFIILKRIKFVWIYLSGFTTSSPLQPFSSTVCVFVFSCFEYAVNSYTGVVWQYSLFIFTSFILKTTSLHIFFEIFFQ